MSQAVNSTSLASRFPQLREQNISFAPGAGGMGIGLAVIGAIMVAACAAIGWVGPNDIHARQALAAYHVGVMSVLAMCLGSLFFLLVFHLTQAGWVAPFRRQLENVASFLPIAYLMVWPTIIAEIAVGGRMFRWLADAATGDPLLGRKSFFFFGGSEIGHGHAPFPIFFVIRAVLYGLVWTLLTRRLISLSREQETAVDATPFAKARFTSAWGMLLFALSTAFAAFDWLMSLDYKFFSTMWGVYYFAGSAFSAAALIAIILAVLRLRGKLEGTVTGEHFHDIGKLLFSFTVFWAYISFSQYFLIWYSNIPEETAFFLHRSGKWSWLGVALMFGHFIIPFVVLLFREVKRNPRLLTLVGIWAIAIHVLDMYWIVRPMVYSALPDPPHGPLVGLTDVLGIVGVLLFFAGYLIKKIPSGNLVGLGDPYLLEGLEHKNYV
ncbi:MAG: hypothetical protein JSR77_06370 [Planctomycetes bacterium]|nr:hypothetical protein [Planctomycetota bacterium]